MQRKASPGGPALLSGGGEWKELLIRSKELSHLLQKRVSEDVLSVETAVCSSGQSSSKSTVLTHPHFHAQFHYVQSLVLSFSGLVEYC